MKKDGIDMKLEPIMTSPWQLSLEPFKLILMKSTRMTIVLQSNHMYISFFKKAYNLKIVKQAEQQ